MSEDQKVSVYNSQESIPKMLDEAFNAGIDRAIELINGRIPSYSNSDLLKVEKEAFLLLFNNLISQLESLKKK